MPVGTIKPNDVTRDMLRVAPAGAKRAENPMRDHCEAMKTAQLWALLRTCPSTASYVYWAKCELRKRGYCV